MTAIEQQKAAREFAERWEGKGYEKGQSQVFWIELFKLYQQLTRTVHN